MNIDEYKNSKFLKFTFTLNIIYLTYKEKGFKIGTKTIWSMLIFFIHKYMFNHIKWYEKLVRRRMRKICPIMESTLDLFLSDKPFSFKDFINSNPDIKKDFMENFETYKENAVKSIIEKENITSEEEIQKLRDSIKLQNYIE